MEKPATPPAALTEINIMETNGTMIMPASAMEHTVRISRFRNRKEPLAYPDTVTWRQLVRELTTERRTAETMAQWDDMGRSQRGAIKDVGGFTGGVFANGRRGNAGDVTRSLVTLDLDNGKYDPDALIEGVARELGCAVCGYSTHSHRRRTPKIRLVIPLRYEMNGVEYEQMTGALIGRCGLTPYADPSTRERSRLFYWHSASKDAPVWTRSIDGAPLDPDTIDYEYFAKPTREERMKGAAAKGKPAPKKGGAVEDPREKEGLMGAFNRAYFPITRAIDKYLAGVYEPCGTDRYTYKGADSEGGLVIKDGGLLAYSFHSNTDPAGKTGHCLNAWDLVALHLFGGDPQGIGMMQLAQKDPAVMREAGAVFDTLGDAPENPETPGLPAGAVSEIQARAAVDALIADRMKDRRPAPHGFNAKIIIANDPWLKGNIGYNQFAECMEARPGLPWWETVHPGEKGAARWTDADLAALSNYMAEHYRFRGKEAVCDGLAEAARLWSHHPVRTYLRSLEWDGVPRVETAVIRLLGARDEPATREMTLLLFEGAVARVMQPGCKFDYMTILRGPQGCFKSTFCRTLFSDWFSDSLDITDDKDSRQHLSGVWGVEMGELAGLGKASVEVIKRFVSQQEDRYRASYGRNMETHLRQCVFMGTTNNEQFLVDDVNRRFSVINIEPSLRVAEDPYDAIAAEKDQLWAEAVHLWDTEWKDRALTLSKAATEEQERRNKAANINRLDPLRQAVADYVNRPLPRDWVDYTVAQRRTYYREADLRDVDESRLIRRTFFSIYEMCVEFWGLTSPSEAKGRKGKMCGGDWQKKVARYLAEMGDWQNVGRQRIHPYRVRAVRWELPSCAPDKFAATDDDEL